MGLISGKVVGIRQYNQVPGLGPMKVCISGYWRKFGLEFENGGAMPSLLQTS
jgi:hypothetical protein